ncbi:MAG TPA: VWA domain-containing protein [Candidatus Acidoferrales bacterium]|nr:VWA domain-containing protein [Candidatus Acidoferrales bacterium]
MTLLREPFSSLRGLALVSAALLFAGPFWISGAEAQAPLIQPTASSHAVPPGTVMTGTDDKPLEVFRTRTDEVNVIFTVTDKHNKFIKDLKESQFKILDNNLPPRQIVNFEAETNMPLRVGLLIDSSISIRDRFLFEQQAATQFLQQIIRPNTDQAFVIGFDEVSNLTQDFTSDMNKLGEGINVIRPGGGTAMWDAVYLACKEKLLRQNEDGNNRTLRKAIVLVSDGDDNQSRVTRQQAFDMAQRSGVIIYTISTNLSNILDSGDRNLKMLAEATGGRAFFPAKLHDLTDAFRSIREELRSQYSVSYKPSEFQNGGQYRPIQIIADNKHLHVRAKKGYYVPR